MEESAQNPQLRRKDTCIKNEINLPRPVLGCCVDVVYGVVALL